MRKRLVELILECHTYTPEYEPQARLHAEYLANHLLNNGVVVPPVFVGSTVYYIYNLLGENCVKELRVTECTFDEEGLSSIQAKTFNNKMTLIFLRNHPYYSFETLRFTKEEAEKALEEMNKEARDV